MLGLSCPDSCRLDSLGGRLSYQRSGSGITRTDLSRDLVTWIRDPGAATVTILIHLAKGFLVLPFPTPTEDRHWASHGGSPTFTHRYKEILGVRCEQVVLTNAEQGASAGESWISEELGLALEEFKPGPNGGLKWRAIVLERTEPDPAALKPPSDYHLMQ